MKIDINLEAVEFITTYEHTTNEQMSVLKLCQTINEFTYDILTNYSKELLDILGNCYKNFIVFSNNKDYVYNAFMYCVYQNASRAFHNFGDILTGDDYYNLVKYIINNKDYRYLSNRITRHNFFQNYGHRFMKECFEYLYDNEQIDIALKHNLVKGYDFEFTDNFMSNLITHCVNKKIDYFTQKEMDDFIKEYPEKFIIRNLDTALKFYTLDYLIDKYPEKFLDSVYYGKQKYINTKVLARCRRIINERKRNKES